MITIMTAGDVGDALARLPVASLQYLSVYRRSVIRLDCLKRSKGWRSPNGFRSLRTRNRSWYRTVGWNRFVIAIKKRFRVRRSTARSFSATSVSSCEPAAGDVRECRVGSCDRQRGRRAAVQSWPRLRAAARSPQDDSARLQAARSERVGEHAGSERSGRRNHQPIGWTVQRPRHQQ